MPGLDQPLKPSVATEAAGAVWVMPEAILMIVFRPANIVIYTITVEAYTIHNFTQQDPALLREQEGQL